MPDAEHSEPFPVEKARSYFRDIACGLMYLHGTKSVVYLLGSCAISDIINQPVSGRILSLLASLVSLCSVSRVTLYFRRRCDP